MIETNELRKRFSWSAIFAGLVVALGTQLVLSLVGIAFGAGSIDLENSSSIAGAGSVAWVFVTAAVSLFLGGLVAGHVAASPGNVDNMIHGVVTWGVASLCSAYLLTTAAGSLLSGTAGIAGKAMDLLGQGAKAGTEQVTDLARNQLGFVQVDISSIKDDAKRLAQDAQTKGSDLQSLIQSAFNGNNPLSSTDRDRIVGVLEKDLNVSHAKAEETVDGWEKKYRQARAQFAKAKEAASQKVREAGDSAAHGVAEASIWSALGLLVSLIASAIGGWLGSPTHTPRLRPVSGRGRHAA